MKTPSAPPPKRPCPYPALFLHSCSAVPACESLDLHSSPYYQAICKWDRGSARNLRALALRSRATIGSRSRRAGRECPKQVRCGRFMNLRPRRRSNWVFLHSGWWCPCCDLWKGSWSIPSSLRNRGCEQYCSRLPLSCVDNEQKRGASLHFRATCRL